MGVTDLHDLVSQLENVGRASNHLNLLFQAAA